MSEEAQITECAGQAKRAAAAILADNSVPVIGKLSYDTIVNLVALGWIEGRLSATDEQLATLSCGNPSCVEHGVDRHRA